MKLKIYLTGEIMKGRVLVIGFIFSFSYLLAGCGDPPPRTMKIADHEFTVPDNFTRWGYQTIKNSASGEEYKELIFNIDADTGKNISPESGRFGINGVRIEVRPIRSEWGQSKFWTDDDPIKKAKEIGCNDIDYQGKKYAVCSLIGETGYTPANREAYYALQNDSNKKEYISVFGCVDTPRSDGLYTCEGHMKIYDSIHVDYIHAAQSRNDVSAALKINLFVRDLILNMADK